MTDHRQPRPGFVGTDYAAARIADLSAKYGGARTAEEVHAESYDNDPEYRAHWDRTRFARQLALHVLHFRTERGLTQADLAEQSGVPATTIERLELGESEPLMLMWVLRRLSTLGLRFHIVVADGEPSLTRSP